MGAAGREVSRVSHGLREWRPQTHDTCAEIEAPARARRVTRPYCRDRCPRVFCELPSFREPPVPLRPVALRDPVEFPLEDAGRLRASKVQSLLSRCPHRADVFPCQRPGEASSLLRRRRGGTLALVRVAVVHLLPKRFPRRFEHGPLPMCAVRSFRLLDEVATQNKLAPTSDVVRPGLRAVRRAPYQSAWRSYRQFLAAWLCRDPAP